MRKLLSIMIINAIVVITCIPSMSLADICEVVDYVSSMSDDKHEMHHGEAHQRLKNDTQTFVIACGCGCHSVVTSSTLPHLLAPHMRAVNPSIYKTQVQQQFFSYGVPLFQYVGVVPIPPPRLT